ncbi:cuticle protein CP14.6-like [Sitodiplosis mosellana]|uniref:cuticle protein CP14.6-like n=1 Tax=Sitodiplosis mosellana TaxID=263140 RepID=UPI002443C077|nr:cuticle protein CP14.6-like [Sitodiplosis mosellana]
MKFVIVFAALIAASVAALLPGATQDAQAYIVSQQADIDPSGNYQYASQTSNGISAQAKGTLNQARSVDASPSYAVQGQYSYTGPDGQVYTINYIADEFGYRASGAHLPVAPQA